VSGGVRERGHVTPPPRYAPVIPMMPVYLEYTPGSGRREGLYNVAGPGGLPCPGQAFLLFPLQPGTLPFCSFCSKQSFLFYSFCRPNRSLRTRKGVVFRSILKEKGKKGTLIALLGLGSLLASLLNDHHHGCGRSAGWLTTVPRLAERATRATWLDLLV
jgi:hypothetical protein